MNIRDTLNKDINSVLKSLIEIVEEKYPYFYTGIVIDNNDPDKLGRCRIRVYGVYDEEIPDSDLPWAQPDFNFIGSKLGSFIIPPVDAIVRVYFDHGDIYLPHYTTKVVERGNLPKDKNTDYPNTLVLFELDEGDKLIYNRKTGTFEFTHRKGTKIKIDGQTGDYELIHNTKTKMDINGRTGDLTLTHGKSGSTIEIDTLGNIKTDHKLFLEDTGSMVIPEGQGPFCALPTCVITGVPHTGRRCAPGV